MYEPVFQPQLGRGPTSSTDCGVRSTQMAIDKQTKGCKAPGPAILRERMGEPDGPTGSDDWERAIESFDTPAELCHKFEPLKGTRIYGGSWDLVINHLRKGNGVVLAVNYGVYYDLMPRKSGSETFKGGHAIYFLGLRDTDRGVLIKAWDPLNDGRRAGIPKGPVWVPAYKVKRAAEAVSTGGVYAVLAEPGVVIGSGAEPGEPPVPVEPAPTLASILADLYDLRDILDIPEDVDAAQAIIEDLEGLIGPYTGDAAPGDEPTVGVK